ncbi:MAG: hypothetical protein ACO3RK_07675 [Luteolibacter sp.]
MRAKSMSGTLGCKAKESHARRLVIAAALTTLVSCRSQGSLE